MAEKKLQSVNRHKWMEEAKSPTGVALGIAVLLAAAGIVFQRAEMRRARDVEPPVVSNIPPPPPAVERTPDMEPAPQTVASAPPLPEDPFNSRLAELQRQAQMMREYAAQAGPDDPFSLSEERIKAFVERGEPTIW